MSVLHLVQIPIAPTALVRWGGERGWAPARGGVGTYDEGLALHRLLTETFGKGALRPFRYMAAPRGKSGNLYAYSRQSEEALREVAAVQAMPDAWAIADPDSLRTRPMPGTWRTGHRLGFDLRLRPVRRLKVGLGSHGPGDEIDVFLHEALTVHPENPEGMRAAGRNREAVYLDWLAERLSPAAEVERAATRLAAFRRLRVVRNGTSIDGPDVVIHGTLTVRDPASFAELLSTGVGRHGAYGYGMMLLRAPQAPIPER